MEGDLGSEEETQNRFNELEASIAIVIYHVNVAASGHGLLEEIWLLRTTLSFSHLKLCRLQNITSLNAL